MALLCCLVGCLLLVGAGCLLAACFNLLVILFRVVIGLLCLISLFGMNVFVLLCSCCLFSCCWLIDCVVLLFCIIFCGCFALVASLWFFLGG